MTKQLCPHCNKSFVNVSLHITKVHDSWMVEAEYENRLSYDLKTKTKIMKQIVTAWKLTKNGEFICKFNSSCGTTGWGNDRTTYSDWHVGNWDSTKDPYILLVDIDNEHAKTKIVYSHYKNGSSDGLTKSSAIVCDNLTVMY